jgi:phosphoribosylaminoimidazolecarboxamide formyltransferase / IMP cyclohydrolase
MIEIKRAVLSVSDKTGIVELANVLGKFDVEILSTGGTAKTLSENGIRVKEVSDFTGSPEILDGRVKTLHPKIYGGLLAVRNNSRHKKEMEENSMVYIDLVVCNLYPFEKTLKSGASHGEIIENIDIGGPTMIRAAAKNYKDVVVLTSPDLYKEFIEQMNNNKGKVDEDFSLKCANQVYSHTSRYDSIISSYLEQFRNPESKMPAEMNIGLKKVNDLRYGENPHQQAAWYSFKDREFERTKLQGKDLSFNNLLDMESTYILVNQFSSPACVITKHTNPCGVAVAENHLSAYEKALETDSLSAFGGIAGFNGTVSAEIAKKITERFFEVVIAPEYHPQALEIFKKKENLRVIKSPGDIKLKYDFRTLNDGFVIQTPDDKETEKFEVVTSKRPDKNEEEALKFAWKVCKFVKSNSIVLATAGQTAGIGAGQMSRFDAARVAVMKMNDNFKKNLKPLVMASDAFFPFPDSIQEAAKAGVTAVIQPGGSIKDKEVKAACEKLGISMVFTGMRHFKH